MNIKTLAIKLAVVPAIVGLALSAHNLSAEDKVETIQVSVEQENDNDAQVELVINGATETFTLAELAKGESRNIITESGKSIIAAKDLDGNTSINIDGKEIQLFKFHGDMGANFNFISSDEVHTSHMALDKIMILGGNLSDEVKEALKATLASYNVDKEVVFPDQSHSNLMFISNDVISDKGQRIDIQNLEGKKIKIIKEVEEN